MGFPGGSVVKNLPIGTGDQFLGWDYPLEKEMAAHSSILAWKNPMDIGAWWAAVSGVAQSQTQLTRVSSSSSSSMTKGGLPWWLSGKESASQCGRHRFNPWIRKIPWRRKCQPTPVFLPGKIPWTEEPGGLQSMEPQKS